MGNDQRMKSLQRPINTEFKRNKEQTFQNKNIGYNYSLVK